MARAPYGWSLLPITMIISVLLFLQILLCICAYLFLLPCACIVGSSKQEECSYWSFLLFCISLLYLYEKFLPSDNLV